GGIRNLYLFTGQLRLVMPARHSAQRAAFTIDAFGKVFLRLKAKSGIAEFSAHVCRHTWATAFMQVPNASLLELKRQGGWAKWEMLERYSHVAPPRDRNALPNPLARLSAENRIQ